MDVHACDIAGKTPLCWAAADGRSAVIRELVAAGADPDHADKKYGLKPLHEAASKNHHEAVTILLESGVDPLTKKTKENPGRFCGNAPRSTGHTPLMYACHNGHLETVEAFLPFLKDLSIVHRALVWASESGRSRVIARILQHPGVDVDARVRGHTALFRACGRGHIEAIDILLNAGADPRVECYDRGDEFAGMGGFPFDPARTHNCLDQLCKTSYRLSYGNRLSPDALQRFFSTFVEAGIDINQRRAGGHTLLHDAVGSPILTRLLLDAGADANAINDSGLSPLHIAKNPDVIALLVEQGQADINLRAMEDGRTPLLRLLSTHFKECKMKLLQYGPKCDVVDNNGDGALHISLSQFNSGPKLVKALLDAGADPNLRNNKGLTPLLSMRMRLADTESLIDLLLEFGADIDAVDRNGATRLFRLISVSDSRRGQGLIQQLIDRGASTSVRDFQGRTCLHAAAKSYNEDRLVRDSGDVTNWGFEFMFGLGLDIQAVDYLGNGLLHELAVHPDTNDPSRGPRLVVFWEQLISLGLDLEQKNHTGRTPLHLMCNGTTNSVRFEPGHVMPIDYVISQTKNLDAPDNEGITPLHIAVTKGLLFTKKILNGGSDPTVCTKQGLTPLHIAARCEESNIVGLLLHALKVKAQGETCLPKFYATALTQSSFLPWDEIRPSSQAVPGVDAEAPLPPPAKSVITPLFYACQSGRPETVALLLEAGADVKNGRVFKACRDFEEENEAWQILEQRNTEDFIFKLSATSNSNIQSSVFIEPRKTGVDYTTRLEEILDLLIRCGADPGGLDISTWSRGVLDRLIQKKHDYVITCFQNAHEKTQGDVALEPEPKSALKLTELLNYRLRKASVLALRGSGFIQPGSEYLELFNQYLARREYYLVEELAHLGANFLPVAGAKGVCKLGTLIKGGYASLLEKVVTIQAESILAQGEWHAFGDDKRAGLWYAKKDINKIGSRFSYHEPFLLVAVQRELPNMDVVRLLVEEFAVDVSELYHTQQYVNNEYKTVPSNSALHSVARGDSWWHVYQALPYLLGKDIDIEIRNHLGQTPLHMALQADGYWPGPFHKNAAKILIEAGADVNAVNGKGESCLVCARHHVDLIKLLISNGAIITPEAILASIDAQNLEALEELLSGGFDPNLRPEKLSEESAKNYLRDRLHAPVKYTLELRETYPLYHAASNILFSAEAKNPQDRRKYENGIKMVQVLLDHGANPFAEFVFRKNCAGGGIYTSSRRKENPDSEDCNKRTILHNLFLLGKPIEPFLSLPSLDVNHRDPQGRTLLHAACESSSGPDLILASGKGDPDKQSNVSVFRRLLDLGAELRARDNRQRNVLHCMINQRSVPTEKSFTYALKAARGLANESDIDGQTPLHYVAKSTGPKCYLRTAKQLRSSGADVLARTKNGDNLLHLQAGNLRTKELRRFFQGLVERGLDVNARNAQGQTPLFRFFEKNKEKKSPLHGLGNRKMAISLQMTIVETFKKLGADFSVRDNTGRGLLHVVASGNVDLFQMLMDEGLDVMLEDDDQKTAIDIAAACENHEVLELFEKKKI